ncbi:hypothetical protein BSKO_03163 [Bryopsis sp. KO-2023]|nr:hypothetical protein BSKO_03163 [Bryopsis sp. KO-2023]
MTSSLLLKCDTYASTLGRRPCPVAPSVVTGIPVPRRPILSNWRPDRFTQRVSRRGRIAIVKASSETEAGVGTTTVKFKCLAAVEFGESMKIVGGGVALGNWDLTKSPTMKWGEGDVWTATVDLPPGKYELKCVKIRGDGAADWEPGKNRIVEVTEEDAAQGILTVDCRFLEAENTVVRSLDESDDFNLEAAGADPHESDSSLANGVTLPDEISIEAVDSKEDGGSDAQSGEGDWKKTWAEKAEEKFQERMQEKRLEEERLEEKKMERMVEEERKKKEVKMEKEKVAEEEAEKLGGGEKKLEEKTEVKLAVEMDEKLEGKEADAEETTKAQTVNEDVSELVDPAGDETSNAASKAGTGGSKSPGAAAAGDWIAIASGLIAAPVVAWSEFTLKTTGCGLVPGPGGLLGALEGVSYLTIMGLAAYFLYRRFSDRPGPEGAAVLVETATYGTIVGGLVVLALQFQEYGYIPSALPDKKCPAQPTPLPELKIDFNLDKVKPNFDKVKPDMEPVISAFSKFSFPSAPSILSPKPSEPVESSVPSVPSVQSFSPAKPQGVSPPPTQPPPPPPPPTPPPPQPFMTSPLKPLSNPRIEEKTEEVVVPPPGVCITPDTNTKGFRQ